MWSMALPLTHIPLHRWAGSCRRRRRHYYPARWSTMPTLVCPRDDRHYRLRFGLR